MLEAQPMALQHAPLLHELYVATPAYFETLGNAVPVPHEVTREVETALFDDRRRLELLLWDGRVIGCLDYKVSFPQASDLTINLLMIRGDCQAQGHGTRALAHLLGRVPPHISRVLASVLGDNPRAVRFWERQGFAFAIDARPAVTWYGRRVNQPVTTGAAS
ncbi:GNAT family N-acetyltransferase [Deinococcus maricopensis]|uniref:GCN5-related N-acetyltransferase n=1 Tax=Deinococcus maricopensis (strain DSM 21211 / LMG 22137 / NRRL B-23946 / LB-34) TaxID=709986 RepID=E8U5P3_DEIML|nr:GNAT family N-acetyltransferase [Deinococcus maricopensis]ADV66382.1 GCN5-related N-acetyltransferase [Deinococcus maricopensis DSM 21211]